MPNLSTEERKTLLSELNQLLLADELTLGQAVRKIRTQLYGMSQSQYSAFVGLSEKTLRYIDKSNTDPKLSSLRKVFKPAGMKIIAQSTYFERLPIEFLSSFI